METEELVEPDLPPATLSEGLLSEDEDFKVETFLKDPVVRVERVNYIFLYKPILIFFFQYNLAKKVLEKEINGKGPIVKIKKVNYIFVYINQFNNFVFR